MDPSQLKFAKTHEWVQVAEGVATVGISQFAAGQLSDLSYIELPEVGRQVSAGEDCGVIETVKAASDLYAPVSGEVVAVNSALEDDYDLLTSDPLGKGWVIRVRMSDPGELDALMDSNAYQAHCDSEAH